MSFNYGLRPTTHQAITSTGTSSQSSAFGSQTEYVRIAATADIYILFGANPTAVSTAGSSTIFVPADEPEVFKVSPGEKVAVIGSAEVSVTEMSAQWLKENLLTLFQDRNQRKDQEDTKRA